MSTPNARGRRRSEAPWHGFLTLSLLPHLQEGIGLAAARAAKTRINYGLDRVRFPHPVRAGSRIRLAATLAAAEPRAPDGILLTSELVVEIEGVAKLALVATGLTLCLF